MLRRFLYCSRWYLEDEVLSPPSMNLWGPLVFSDRAFILDNIEEDTTSVKCVLKFSYVNVTEDSSCLIFRKRLQDPDLFNKFIRPTLAVEKLDPWRKEESSQIPNNMRILVSVPIIKSLYLSEFIPTFSNLLKLDTTKVLEDLL